MEFFARSKELFYNNIVKNISDSHDKYIIDIIFDQLTQKYEVNNMFFAINTNLINKNFLSENPNDLKLLLCWFLHSLVQKYYNIKENKSQFDFSQLNKELSSTKVFTNTYLYDNEMLFLNILNDLEFLNYGEDLQTFTKSLFKLLSFSRKTKIVF